ncbi:MAG TPA: malate synthase A, partial [Candidatus Nanopelagicales bacterium]|nr:malate synthase A [Candidatus Nanopelagicales bacterium]
MSSGGPSTISVQAPPTAWDDAVLTPDALGFLTELGRAFALRVPELLQRRRDVQARLDGGFRFDFLPETQGVREGDWTVAPLPQGLLDRRVEITGPVDRKMIINALNSGANVFMADFEDSNAPTWE